MLNIRRGKFEAITADDLRAAEERDGAIQDGDLVLINTGCHQYYYDEAYNCAPYLTKEAAESLGLMEGMPVIAGGIDCGAANIGLGVLESGIYAAAIGTSMCAA